MSVERQVELRFHATSREARTHPDLSAVGVDGPGLRAAGDETVTVEHLTFRDGPSEARPAPGGGVLADIVRVT
ncbi:hypothetical protein [Streptosporangium sp. NPDC003464]